MIFKSIEIISFNFCLFGNVSVFSGPTEPRSGWVVPVQMASPPAASSSSQPSPPASCRDGSGPDRSGRSCSCCIRLTEGNGRFIETMLYKHHAAPLRAALSHTALKQMKYSRPDEASTVRASRVSAESSALREAIAGLSQSRTCSWGFIVLTAWRSPLSCLSLGRRAGFSTLLMVNSSFIISRSSQDSAESKHSFLLAERKYAEDFFCFTFWFPTCELKFLLDGPQTSKGHERLLG